MIKTGGDIDRGLNNTGEEETVRRRLELARVFKCGMLVEVDGNGELMMRGAGEGLAGGGWSYRGGRKVGRRDIDNAIS